MCYLGSTVVHFAVILFYLFYCQGAVTMEGKTKQDSETERYPHLKYMLSEYIKELCENYCLDLKVLKTKEERVKALQTIPNLSDVTSKFSPKMSVNSPIVKFRLEGLHPLGAEDDLECYLSTFERLCNSQEIPSKRWPILLEPYLTGKAQKAFHILSESQKQSYVVVKDALLAAFQLTPDTYREKFRSAVKGPSETFRQYGSRLSLYLRRWTAPTDRLASSPEFTRIMDLIAVDQMISSLRDESLRLKLLEQKWTSLVEISDFADNILVARVTSRNRQSQGSRSMSATTRPYFHTAGETTGQSQRPAFSQASRIRRPATDLNNIRCYTCGEWGHFSYNCSNVSRDQNANVGINLVRISDKEVEERFSELGLIGA
ncbi:hypothetical protein BSL78_22954 [Apostichopus japonicus]|uniref:CCHC-type domain-containing protein n=1 Tax=Stichopus japonicus TaxID=307972 RepID=A0A2G8JWS1_STIJA|nr:hypothetical protein BSL78_22954 [Apostichopus japonicus]